MHGLYSAFPGVANIADDRQLWRVRSGMIARIRAPLRLPHGIALMHGFSMLWRSALFFLGLVGAAFAQERVIFLLPAPQFLPAFAPHNVALVKGYYRQEGAEVEFRTLRGGAEVAARLSRGEGDLGGATADTAIQARAQGALVRNVALLGGRSLTQLVFRKDKNIYQPAELRGKRITVMSFTDTSYYALLGFLNSVGLSKQDVSIQEAGPVGVFQNVIDDKADGMAGVPDWIPPFRDKGIDISVMQVGRFFPNMAQTIIAADRHIKERPDAIRAFVRATLHGLKDVMEDPAAATALIVKAYPKQHLGHEEDLRETLEYYVRYVYPGQRTLGEMSELRLSQLQDFYVREGIIERAAPVKDLYTNEFVLR